MTRQIARSMIVPAIAAAAFAVTASHAHAVSQRVKPACASDYYSHCSHHSPGSAGVRQCMRKVGSRLSSRCVNALVSAGEVSAAEVSRRRAARRTAAR